MHQPVSKHIAFGSAKEGNHMIPNRFLAVDTKFQCVATSLFGSGFVLMVFDRACSHEKSNSTCSRQLGIIMLTSTSH